MSTAEDRAQDVIKVHALLDALCTWSRPDRHDALCAYLHHSPRRQRGQCAFRDLPIASLRDALVRGNSAWYVLSRIHRATLYRRLVELDKIAGLAVPVG